MNLVMNQVFLQKPRVQRIIKYILFACICAAVVMPSLIIGFFQTERFSNKAVHQLYQHLETLIQESKSNPLVPGTTVAMLQVNELVLWSRYLKNNLVLSQSGLYPRHGEHKEIVVVRIDPGRRIQDQFKTPTRVSSDDIFYKLEIPLPSSLQQKDRLEIGVSFEPIFSMQRDIFSLTGVIFFTAFLFLLSIYIFIDTHITTLISKLIRAFSVSPPVSQNLENLEQITGTMTFFTPALRELSQAVHQQSTQLSDERSARITLEAFNAELNLQLAEQRRRLEETHRELIQSAKLAAIGELAGGVAHEINNPNGVILAGAKHLKTRLQKNSEQLPEYVSSYLDRIIRQSSRIAEIVNALLTFSRRRPKEKNPLLISDSIQDALELISHRLSRNGVRLQYIPDPSIEKVIGNRNDLGQVFLNLFNNALDAMPDGGTLTIQCEQHERKIVITVHNTGENIPAEILNKIMEPFFTTKPLGRGTGLGLSVSLGIMEDHGGSLKASNHPKGGVVFELELPAIEISIT